MSLLSCAAVFRSRRQNHSSIWLAFLPYEYGANANASVAVCKTGRPPFSLRDAPHDLSKVGMDEAANCLGIQIKLLQGLLHRFLHTAE